MSLNCPSVLNYSICLVGVFPKSESLAWRKTKLGRHAD